MRDQWVGAVALEWGPGLEIMKQQCDLARLWSGREMEESRLRLVGSCWGPPFPRGWNEMGAIGACSWGPEKQPDLTSGCSASGQHLFLLSWVSGCLWQLFLVLSL